MPGPEQKPFIETKEWQPQESCGIVGFVPRTEDPVELTVAGLVSSHNRGEDWTGLAVFDPDLTIIKNRGTTDRAFKGGALLEELGEAKIALGHVGYCTDEDTSLQPLDQGFAFAHNGQFTNSRALAKRYGVEVNGDSDSEVASKLIAHEKENLGSSELALDALLPKLAGAFSLALMEKDRIIAARDRRGWRPLNVGRLADGGYGASSESAVFKLIGGELIGPVEPGTYAVITKDKIETHRWMRPEHSTCGLEYAYFSRADSEIDGIGVAKARYRMGEFLAEDFPLDVDIVIPMPESGRHAATGYADKSGHRLADGFYRNHDLGRIYIKSASRGAKARLKNSAIEDVVKGMRVVVVDDSAIRGDTAKNAAASLYGAGAEEVHWLSAFPKVISECYYGMNMRQRDGLIAIGHSNKEIAQEMRLDSINYLSVERFQEAVHRVGSLCMACTTGNYPEPIEPEMIVSERIPA